MREEIHSRVNDNLFPYLDGLLDDAARGEVDAHQEQCPECRHDLELCRRANKLFASMPQPALPEGFSQRLLKGLPHTGSNGHSHVIVQTNGYTHGTNGTNGHSQGINGRSHGTNGRSNGHSSGTAPSPGRKLSGKQWVLGVAASLALVLVLTRILLSLAIQPYASRVGGLAYAEGEVYLAGHRVSESTYVREGQTVSTGEGSRAIISVSQHASIRLGPQTQIILRLDNAQARVEVESGRIWVEESGQSRIEVATKEALLAPQGTEFDVRLQGPKLDVTVWDGRVSVTPTVSHSVAVLAAGQKAKVSGRGVQVAALNLASAMAEPWVQWNVHVAPPSQMLEHRPLDVPLPARAQPAILQGTSSSGSAPVSTAPAATAAGNPTEPAGPVSAPPPAPHATGKTAPEPKHAAAPPSPPGDASVRPGPVVVPPPPPEGATLPGLTPGPAASGSRASVAAPTDAHPATVNPPQTHSQPPGGTPGGNSAGPSNPGGPGSHSGGGPPDPGGPGSHSGGGPPDPSEPGSHSGGGPPDPGGPGSHSGGGPPDPGGPGSHSGGGPPDPGGPGSHSGGGPPEAYGPRVHRGGGPSDKDDGPSVHRGGGPSDKDGPSVHRGGGPSDKDGASDTDGPSDTPTGDHHQPGPPPAGRRR